MTDLTVIEDDFYPKLNIVVSSQYPSITISPPKNVLIGGGGGGQVGPRGIQGLQGIQGIQGLIGSIGPTGPKGDKYRAVSFTPLTVGSLTNVTLTLTENDFSYTPKQEVIVVSSSDINLYFIGTIISYSENTLEISVTSQSGASFGNSWLINLFGLQGPAGETGEAGPQGPRGSTGATGAPGATGAIGPVGYDGRRGVDGPTGAQGIQGIQGVQGIQGIQGTQGNTGSLDLQLQIFDTGVSFQNTFTTSSESGLGRKVVFLAEDGSLIFDYIKKFDVFDSSQFVFSVASFSLNSVGLQSGLTLMGSGTLSLSGGNISATYTFGPPTGATLSVSSGSGFSPVTLSSPYTSYSFTSETLTYPASINNTLKLKILAEKSGSTSERELTIGFRNNFYHGVTADAGYTLIQNFASSLITTAIGKQFSYSGSGLKYGYWAYPKRLGETKYFFGGFPYCPVLVGEISFTNSAGFQEDYYVYRTSGQNVSYSETHTLIASGGCD